MRRLLLTLLKFPRLCAWGKFVILIAGILVMIPWSLDLKNKEKSLPETLTTNPAAQEVGAFNLAILRRAEATPYYGPDKYFPDALAIKKREAEFVHRYKETPYGSVSNVINQLCSLRDQAARSGRTPTAVWDKWVEWFHVSYYRWYVHTYRCEPPDASTYRAYVYPAEGTDYSELSSLGLALLVWVLQLYLVGIIWSALTYLFRFGEEGNEQVLETLMQKRSFAQACLLWPTHFFRYPFAYLRELRIAITEQRHRENICEKITAKDRERYRQIARSTERFDSWKRELKTRTAPRWGFALALLATVTLLTLPKLAGAECPCTGQTVHTAYRARGHPPWIARAAPAHCTQSIAETAALWLFPALVAGRRTTSTQRTAFAELTARLQAGWRDLPDKVPLCSQ